MLYEQDELVDIVNERDEVIDTMFRSEARKKGLFPRCRSVSAFLRDTQGRLWIPRRTAHKTVLPNALDFSAAGGVQSGESYDQAFKREVKEELGIDVTEYTKLGEFVPQRDGVLHFCHVYEIVSDTVPAYNPEDFSEFFWLSPEQVIEKIDTEGGNSKQDLPFFVRHLYLERRNK